MSPSSPSPPSCAIAALDALGRKGCRAVIVFTAGFAEMDAAGAEAQDRLTAVAQAARHAAAGAELPRRVQRHASRFYGTFTASFEKGWPVPGRIGIASQSGAYGTHIFAAALDRGIGTQVCITTGNEAEVALGDVLGWMAQAPEVDVICAYAEGIRESAQFIAALELAAAQPQADRDDEGRPQPARRRRGASRIPPPSPATTR